MMSRFFKPQSDKQELEETVRRRIRGEPPPSDPDALTVENLVESIRSLAVELKRGGIEIRSMRASARGITVIGVGANRPVERWYSAMDLQGLANNSGSE
jgi:hypothetical protein